MQGFWVQFCRPFFCHRSQFQLTQCIVRSLGDRFLSSCTRWNDWSGCGSSFVLHLLRTFIDALWPTYDGRLICNIYFVMQGFWVLQFNAHFCVIMHGFQLTWRIAWSLSDSWASFHLLIQDWLVWMWFLHVVVHLLRMFIDALFVTTVCQQTKVYLVYMDSVCMLT